MKNLKRFEELFESKNPQQLLEIWKAYTVVLDGLIGIIEEQGELSDSYWQPNVEEDMQSLVQSISKVSDLVANEDKILKNCEEILDGLEGAIGSGKISEDRYFQRGAIDKLKELTKESVNEGHSTEDEQNMSRVHLEDIINNAQEILECLPELGDDLPAWVQDKISVSNHSMDAISKWCRTTNEGKKKGLWDNIHAKRKRGEEPAKPGDEEYPDKKSWDKLKKGSKKDKNKSKK